VNGAIIQSCEGNLTNNGGAGGMCALTFKVGGNPSAWSDGGVLIGGQVASTNGTFNFSLKNKIRVPAGAGLVLANTVAGLSSGSCVGVTFTLL
jgi:hypothetical protein